ncbi:MAG: prepilin-type N-terminal cleavage/methylation domain-containing protein [Clostridiales bacterium]|nr:prepilin-type N-terminal cleavage/methylation domain-containing protein [Clostridiales bacterium]
MKKKGVTLIEIIISMALMTVLLIPAANVVITAKKLIQLLK